MFLPKKSRIFEKVASHSLTVQEAADVFYHMVERWGDLAQDAEKLRVLEARADEWIHQVTDEVEKMFILPFDKEDIVELVQLLDDIADKIEEAAHRISIYHLEQRDETLKEFAALVAEAVHQVHGGVLLVSEHQLKAGTLAEISRRLHALESQADAVHRRVLARLMGDVSPSTGTLMTILKWKEVYQLLEDTLDCCEDLAILFERLRIKYR